MVVDRLSHFWICLCYLREHGMLQDHFMAKRRGICRSIANSELIPKRNSELIRISDFQGRGLSHSRVCLQEGTGHGSSEGRIMSKLVSMSIGS